MDEYRENHHLFFARYLQLNRQEKLTGRNLLKYLFCLSDITCQVYIRPHKENVGPAGVNSVGFSSLTCAVDLLNTSRIISFLTTNKSFLFAYY
jgi:hypothetical protein